MNSRKMCQETARLAKQRDWAEGDPRKTYLLTLLSARENARSSLRNKIQDLRENLNYLDNELQSDSPILNTLGELQGRPAAIEAKVGEFAATDKALREYLKAFPEIDSS